MSGPIRPRKTRRLTNSLKPTAGALRERFSQIVIPPTAEVIKQTALSCDQDIEGWKAQVLVKINQQHRAWRASAMNRREVLAENKAIRVFKRELRPSSFPGNSSIATRNEIVEFWADRLRVARLNYKLAESVFRQVIAGEKKWPLSQLDGSALVNAARLEELAARKQYLQVLKILGELLASGDPKTEPNAG